MAQGAQDAHGREGYDPRQKPRGGGEHRRRKLPNGLDGARRPVHGCGLDHRYREVAGVGFGGLAHEEGESTPAPDSRRSYTRYFFTTFPPMASMPRFIAVFVSRIQPISPPL